ncbi:MAG: hypothetical protein EOO43_23870, partial [Flavobacterium sp.]
DYEMKREGEGAGDTQNITNIFMNIYRLGNRISGEGDTKEERFWDTALKRCLNRSIDLIKLAGEDLTYRNMVRLLSTSNEVNLEKLGQAVINAIEGNGKKYMTDDHYCLSCLIKAYFSVGNEPAYTEKSNMHDMVVEYFTYSLNSLGEHVKPAVIESFMGLAEPFLSGILRRHFSSATTLHPELTYTKQKVIVLDAKYKGMSGNKRDLDREDFYQIHSYMSYFSDNLLAGSLLYPISNDIDYTKTIQPLFGNNKNNSKFFVSGIKLTENMTFDEISNSENDFINSIKNKVQPVKAISSSGLMSGMESMAVIKEAQTKTVERLEDKENKFLEVCNEGINMFQQFAEDHQKKHLKKSMEKFLEAQEIKTNRVEPY